MFTMSCFVHSRVLKSSNEQQPYAGDFTQWADAFQH